MWIPSKGWGTGRREPSPDDPRQLESSHFLKSLRIARPIRGKRAVQAECGARVLSKQVSAAQILDKATGISPTASISGAVTGVKNAITGVSAMTKSSVSKIDALARLRRAGSSLSATRKGAVVDHDSREVLTAKLVAFYKQHKPENIAQVDKVVDYYFEDQSDLSKELRATYGTDLSAIPDPFATAEEALADI